MLKSLSLLGLGLTFTAVSCAGPSDPPSLAGADRETIVGGKADTMSRSIFVIAMSNGGLCSGTLILPNLVLTAHHCVSPISGMNGVVACGMTTFGSTYRASDFRVSWDDSIANGTPDSTIYEVSAVRVPTDNDVCGNDIALLQLSTNVPASQATPLAPRLDSEVETDEVFNAVGYGITSPNDTSGSTAGTRMRFDGASVICVGATECRGTGATATEWVAESPVCSGDSGGPALDLSDRVIGVVSRGPEECDMAVYSAVYPWRSLIIDAATDAVEDGGYDPPSWVTGMPADGGAPMPDGGTPMTDAGTGDGGLPVMDAGSMDGGAADAGTTDAGPSDAGTPTDAGTMDAGSTDAGAMLDGGSGAVDAGMTADSGAPLDGSAPTPDSGLPMMDASTATPDGGSLDAGRGDHLGESCTGTCPAGYLCFADDGVPPGICVPPCNSGTRCPTGYECSESLDVCKPSSTHVESETPEPAGCGCRTARTSRTADFGAAAWTLLLALGTLLRRRRYG